mgnify:CR=1 FL=1
MEIIEITSAKTMWEKTTQRKNELERIEKERREKASYEELKRAINEIKREIEKAIDKGHFGTCVWFKETHYIFRSERDDNWYYLPSVNKDKIIEMFSIAGYKITWQNSASKYEYGYFDIEWTE